MCLAAACLWFRASAGRPGDHIGWKQQQAHGKEWVQEEWCAYAAAGRVQFLSFRTTSGASGESSAKAHVRFGVDGFFWTPAVEAPKPTVTIKSTSQPAATQPITAPHEGPTFALINETTETAQSRGAAMPLWLLTAVTALLPARWVLLAMRQRKEFGHGSVDRVPMLARLFSTFASVSILLAVGLGVLWLKSWYVGDRVSWRDAHRPQFVDLHSGRGELVAHCRRVAQNLLHTAPELDSAPNGVCWRQDSDATVGYTQKLFCFEHDHQQTKEGESWALTVAAPYWFLVVLALVPPSWWLRNQKYGRMNLASFGGTGRGGHERGKEFVPTFVGNRPL